MKIKLLFFSLLFSYQSNSHCQSIYHEVYNSFVNIFSNSRNALDIQPAPQSKIEDAILNKIIELQRIGNHFKYYRELSKGQYIVDCNDQKLSIKFLKHSNPNLIFDTRIIGTSDANINNEILDVIDFEIVNIDNFISFQMKDYEKFVNEKALLEDLGNTNNLPGPLAHNFVDKILIDKEIGNLSLVSPIYPNLGKVFNRSIVRQRVVGSNHQPVDLFADATAGTVIPLPLGAGSPKVLIVDKIWDRIIMMDRDIANGSNTLAYAYPLFPGNPYKLMYPTDIVQGPRRVFIYGGANYKDSIVSMYIADNGNNRIVRVDYAMEYIDFGNGFLYDNSSIRDASFRVLSNNCTSPYSLAIHKGIQQLNQPEDSTHYVLWYSEGLPGNKKLVCINAISGQFMQEIRSVKGINISPFRISSYRSPDGQKNLLAFIDEVTNMLCILRLETDGTFVNSDVNVRYFQNFGIIQLKSVILSSYNNATDGVTVWTVGDGGAGNCQGQVHCSDVSTLKINYLDNFPVKVEYLATYWSGSGSPSSFVNL